jgi:hypothetical protein
MSCILRQKTASEGINIAREKMFCRIFVPLSGAPKIIFPTIPKTNWIMPTNKV